MITRSKSRPNATVNANPNPPSMVRVTTPVVIPPSNTTNRGPVFLIIDSESFRVQTRLSSQTVVPLQLAWSVCYLDENSTTLKELVARNVYVSEVFCQSAFRDSIRRTSERTFLKHEAKMKTSQFPMMNMSSVLRQLRDDIVQLRVTHLVAYNISWDFKSISNAIELFCEDRSAAHMNYYDSRCDNPFNPMKLGYVDLMHQVIKRYGPRLVSAGINDGTVSFSEERNQISLRKVGTYEKSVFSAEYVLQHLFGEAGQQQHLADEDVHHETMILQQLIHDFGYDRLEFNILYPHLTSLQYMQKLASTMMRIPTATIAAPPTTAPPTTAQDEEATVAQILRSLSITTPPTRPVVPIQLTAPPIQRAVLSKPCMFTTDANDDQQEF